MYDLRCEDNVTVPGTSNDYKAKKDPTKEKQRIDKINGECQQIWRTLDEHGIDPTEKFVSVC